MIGILREAKSRRHFLCKNYEIKRKKEHWYEDLCR